jgi:hypothetical protein
MRYFDTCNSPIQSSRLLFVLFGCYLCCLVIICVVQLLFVLFSCCVVQLFVLFGCYLCCSVVICVVQLLFELSSSLCCSVVICLVRLLFVLFYVLFVCKCVLPPGDNPIAVNKYTISHNIISYTPCLLPIYHEYSIQCLG